MPPKTQPDYYESQLTQESADLREKLESSLDQSYADLDSLKGVHRLKAQKAIDLVEEQLAWQGADPRKIPFADLKAHVQYPHNEDALENKYQARIKNRATAIRGFCVLCQGGSTSSVKDCPSITCPLYPFRMGKDPLRGYELPKVAPIIIEDEDGDDLFEDGDGEDDADATE